MTACAPAPCRLPAKPAPAPAGLTVLPQGRAGLARETRERREKPAGLRACAKTKSVFQALFYHYEVAREGESGPDLSGPLSTKDPGDIGINSCTGANPGATTPEAWSVPAPGNTRGTEP